MVILVGLRHDLLLDSAEHKARIQDLCGIPLGITFALIGVADLFLGIDSAMLHIADLYRIPGVGIFGSTDPKQWGFRFSPHRHVIVDDINSTNINCVVNALIELDETRISNI